MRESAKKEGRQCQKVDNGSEFIAQKVRKILSRLNVKPSFIEPGSPRENSYTESFNFTK
jgi:transposase InsO family protein